MSAPTAPPVAIEVEHRCACCQVTRVDRAGQTCRGCTDDMAESSRASERGCRLW